jgi:hypothetical protein
MGRHIPCRCFARLLLFTIIPRRRAIESIGRVSVAWTVSQLVWRPWRSRQWTLKSLTLSVSCGAWWRPLHLPLRFHRPKRPLATRIGYMHLQFSQHRLNDIGLTREQHKWRLRTGLREFNGTIPAATDSKVRRKNSRITNPAADQPSQKWLRRGKHNCLSNSVMPALIYRERFLMRLLVLFAREFVCLHAFLASRRIDC